MGTRLTIRRLRALEAAVLAMAAGMEGEGDWPDDVSRGDMDSALDWVSEQMAKRPALPTQGAGQ